MRTTFLKTFPHLCVQAVDNLCKQWMVDNLKLCYNIGATRRLAENHSIYRVVFCIPKLLILNKKNRAP